MGKDHYVNNVPFYMLACKQSENHHCSNRVVPAPIYIRRQEHRMGKKKKSGKKKGKKSGKSSGKSVRSAITDPPKDKVLDESSRLFWERQLSDLHKRVKTDQNKCDELEIENQEMSLRYEQLVEDKESIEFYLHKSLKEKQEQLNELHSKLIELQQAKEFERESFENQLASLEADYTDTKETLLRENENLETKLTSMRDIELQRSELMDKFKKVDEDLDKQANKHLEHIYNLERQMVVDKDRLRKEAVQKVNNLAMEFRKVSDKQMAETTKRALRANVSMNKSLHQSSDHTMSLIDDSDDLKLRAHQHTQLIELLEFTEKELTRKFNNNVENIKRLLNKIKSTESQIADYEKQNESFDASINDHRMICENVYQHQINNSEVKENISALHARLDEVSCEEQTLLKKKGKLQNLLLETATAVEFVINIKRSDDDKGREIGKRDVLMEHLIRLLTTASQLGVGPQPNDFQVVRPSFYKQVNPPQNNEKQDFATYRGGVLGLIPMADRNEPKTFLETIRRPGTHSSSASQRGSLLRSVATQTVSAPKAVFIAKKQVMTKPPNALKKTPLSTNRVY